MPVMPFATVEEAIALANDTIFGLSAAVFAGSQAQALKVARHLDAGAINIMLGMAFEWVAQARAAGITVSNKPVVGAITCHPPTITNSVEVFQILLNPCLHTQLLALHPSRALSKNPAKSEICMEPRSSRVRKEQYLASFAFTGVIPSIWHLGQSTIASYL